MNKKAEFDLKLEKLMKLEPRILAESLMKLSVNSRSAWMMVEQLTADFDAKIATFRDELQLIIHSSDRGKFMSGEEILKILTEILWFLDNETIPAETGLSLMESFFCTDAAALESSTELDAEFSMLYEYHAVDIFANFASKVSNNDLVIQTLRRLADNDSYGVRDRLIKQASSYLLESDVHRLTEKD